MADTILSTASRCCGGVNIGVHIPNILFGKTFESSRGVGPNEFGRKRSKTSHYAERAPALFPSINTNDSTSISLHKESQPREN